MSSQGIIQPPETTNVGLTPLKGWRRTFSAFRNPNYRFFFSGQTISLIGTWTRTTALGWVSFQFTHSEFLLGIVFMLNAFPFLLFSIYAGSLADRVPKIRMFILTSWFSLLSSLTLAVMLFYGPVHISYLMVFSFIWGLATTFEMPSRQTLVVELVGKTDLVNAIALNSAMVNSTRIIGPAIGGILLASFGAAWCFLLDAFSYLAVLYALHKIKLSATHYMPQKARTNREHILEGFRYLKTNSAIAEAMAMLLIVGMGGWAYQSQLSAFVATQLNMGAQGYGWLLAMNGFGACTAALFVANKGARIVCAKTLYIGTGIYGIFIILFGFMHHPFGAAFLIFFAGFGIILFYSTGNSIIQTQSPDHLRGRLMGIWALVFGGGLPIGSFCIGFLASHTSSGFSLQMGGLFCLLGAFAVHWFFRSQQFKQ
ncbi:MAG: MFS transporter [Candidatus Riflebacteria bacterium]|nr:MFS transporter [Candidatus Riflebacteria bacterium]